VEGCGEAGGALLGLRGAGGAGLAEAARLHEAGGREVMAVE